MDLWIMAFVGGLVGSAFMDIMEMYMGKVGIYSGVKGTHIGRWAHGLAKGKLYYDNIDDAAPVNNEIRIAFIFHYLVGGGFVALGYPVMLYFVDVSTLFMHLPLAVIYGLLTCAFPWLILMPSLGKGIAGNKMPTQVSPIIAPIGSHLAYGLGIGVTVFLYGLAMA